MVFRFAGFELDRQRAELRGPDGEAIRLRPKTFDMLLLLVANAGRILSKQELMEAVWPNVHVSEDSLFQCIRELRAALGDAERQLIKVVTGRGYLFEAAVSDDSAEPAVVEPAPAAPADRPPLPFGLRRSAAIAVLAGLCALIGLAIAGPLLLSAPAAPTLAVSPIADLSGDPDGTALAVAVTDQLIDGLAEIDNIRVVARPATGTPPSFVIESELGRDLQSWTLKARLIESATGQVHAVATVAVDSRNPDTGEQQARLVAGVGDALARSLNALLEDGHAAGSDSAPTTSSRVAIEEAMASINETTRERFAVAEAMLKNALAAEPDNVDLQVALAALQLRGILMAWYAPDERAAAERQAGALLDSALAARPRSMAALEARCRLLTATDAFAESLVACGQVLSFDPWNGSARYLVGLGQLYLGRFEDALETFTLAERYDTPAVSRWTWLQGAGFASLLLDRNEDALAWLERSVAITPASGRSHMMLAVAYQRLGRADEAKAAMAEGLALRPESTAANVAQPTGNTSTVFLTASNKAIHTMVALGLPER